MNRSHPPTASRRLRSLAAAAFGLAIGAFGVVDIAPNGAAGDGPRIAVGFAVPSAEAGPVGVARRTARRVTRRTVAWSTVARCPYRHPYHLCGGVYYSPVVRNGATVYVEVDPGVAVTVHK